MMSIDQPLRRHVAHATVASAAAALAALALLAVPAAAQTTTTTTPRSSLQFATGSVTSVHGTSVQVANSNLNTESTVVLQDSTTYTKRVTADGAAVTVGACLRATGTGSDPKHLTATSVMVSEATSSGCTSGFGARGGPRPDLRGGQRPALGRGQRPNFGGRSRTRPANFATAFGPVLSVSGDKVTVKSTTFVRPASTSSDTKSSNAPKPAKGKTRSTAKTTTTNVVVTIGPSTTITQTVNATAADVTVGKCVTATGTSGAGAVDATRVGISDPVNGDCTSGFNGRFGGAPGGASPGPSV